jgi:hypothetical protein
MQSMLGTWKLIEGYALDKSGNRLPSPFGPQPIGVAEFGPERMIGVTGDARSSLPPEVNSRFWSRIPDPIALTAANW